MANNVLVLYNADQGDMGPGHQIADYYRQARPGVHLLGLTGIDSILTGNTSETVSADNYLNVIRPQILSAIAGLPDSIEVIVTTKGLPLKIDSGSKAPGSTALLWRRYSSLESELTRIDSITSRDAMGNQFIYTGFPDLDPTPASNPYYNSNQPFTRAGSDPLNGDIRLSARLDGFDVETVKKSIERAQSVVLLPQSFSIVADDDPSANTDQMIDNVPGGPGPGLVNAVRAAGYNILYDSTDNALTTAPNSVSGYVSHGTQDGPGGLETGYLRNQLDFELANGSVFLTHESWNASSFDSSVVQSQGQVAEWLEIGGTAGIGHVHEPYNGPDNVTNEDLLFSGLLPRAEALPGSTGLTFVEAAWNATRQLSYVNTVVGDPLMKWQKWIPGDINLDGQVEFQDFYTLQGNWGEDGTYQDGDFNNDGQVDLGDFEILQANWLSSGETAAMMMVDIQVIPIINELTGLPDLSAMLLSPANFDGDLDVDSEDLARILSSYGINAGGDVDGDGDTDGRDFLAYQQQALDYSFTADFDIDAEVCGEDLEIWQQSYNENRGGDTDGDGDTDGRDFLAWQREFNGVLVESTNPALTVPEPSSLSLLLWCLPLAHRVRLRNQSRDVSSQFAFSL
ncbi:MAG: hypothetical protein SH868_09020 [Bythopirellula sp.]|nr:hypothetical protein [Bythopirellula sp.]